MDHGNGIDQKESTIALDRQVIGLGGRIEREFILETRATAAIDCNPQGRWLMVFGRDFTDLARGARRKADLSCIHGTDVVPQPGKVNGDANG